MEKVIYFLFIIFIILSCSKNDPDALVPEPELEPCSELVDGVYIFPTQKPDSTLTNDEKREYWNIPEEVLTCISTEGLITSCYNQKFSIFISAGNGYQHGYQVVKGWNRGFEELETRDEAPGKLIEFYDTISIPARINYNLFSVEVLIAQDAVLTKLTNEQKIKLLSLCLKYHPEVRKIWTQSGFLFDGTVVIMCQMMRLDNYEPFLQHIESDSYLNTFVEGYSYSLSFERGDTIVAFTQNYLQELILDSN